MKRLSIVLVLSLVFISACVTAAPQAASSPNEPIDVPECAVVPVIDGRPDDACWSKTDWRPIDQVWIPWGGTMDPADFSGRYKLAWSSVTDRLYFLVEITDDALVDGYAYPMPQYHNWDVLEIFLDENASGGDHTLNQNAFAYHITAGNARVGFQAMDLAADWAVMNYSDHLECVIGRPEAGRYVWEIALTVYDDAYRPGRRDNPTLPLAAGKICGLSLAYCDNDDPREEPKTRDNFIGSVRVPRANYNDHWQNAGWFGRIRLVPTE